MRRLLFVLLLLCPAAAWAGVNLAEAPIDRLSLSWWQDRWALTKTEAQADPDAKIIWLGDSITYNWQRDGGHGYDDILPLWTSNYAPYHALDFGFTGDTTANLIWRLDHGQVTGLHPRLVIILIGANNFGAVHWDANQTVPGIESVVRLTHERLPDAHILLLGVLPSIRSAWVDAQTTATNGMLARYYRADPTTSFIDLTKLFLLKNGQVDATLYIDPRLSPPRPALHPDHEAMGRIAAALAPLVQKYAGSP